MDRRWFAARPGPWPALAPFLALGLLLLAPASAALAQQGGGFEPMPKFTPDIGTLRTAPLTQNSRQDIFQLLDSDGNGVIDRAEWRDRKMLIFYVRDSDRDLQLTPAELAGIPSAVFKAADLNGDGLLSGFEFNQAKFTDFEAVDLNHDGVVLFEEFSEALDRLQHPSEPAAPAPPPQPTWPSDPAVDGGFGPTYPK